MKQHKLFADWYRVADPALTKEKLDLRWTAIEELCEQYDWRQWLACVKIYLSLGPTDEEKTALADVFKEPDPTFPMQDNAQLLRVLAGSAIGAIASSDRASGMVPSLAHLCATCQGTRARGILDGVLDECRNHVARVAKEEHQAPPPEVDTTNLTLPDVEVPHSGLADSLQSISHPSHLSNAADPNFNKIAAAVRELEDAVEALSTQVTGSLSELNSVTRRVVGGAVVKEIRLLHEENAVLWWLLGETSRELRVPLRTLGAGAIVVVGKELGDILSSLHPASRAYLSRALRSAELEPDSPHSLREVLQSVPTPLESWRGEIEVGSLKPLLVVSEALASVSEAKEATSLRLGGDIDGTTELSAIDWAEQTYLETQLIAHTSRQ